MQTLMTAPSLGFLSLPQLQCMSEKELEGRVENIFKVEAQQWNIAFPSNFMDWNPVIPNKPENVISR